MFGKSKVKKNPNNMKCCLHGKSKLYLTLDLFSNERFEIYLRRNKIYKCEYCGEYLTNYPMPLGIYKAEVTELEARKAVVKFQEALELESYFSGDYDLDYYTVDEKKKIIDKVIKKYKRNIKRLQQFVGNWDYFKDYYLSNIEIVNTFECDVCNLGDYGYNTIFKHDGITVSERVTEINKLCLGCKERCEKMLKEAK